jgi:hypothetical protein
VSRSASSTAACVGVAWNRNAHSRHITGSSGGADGVCISCVHLRHSIQHPAEAHSHELPVAPSRGERGERVIIEWRVVSWIRRTRAA